VEYQTALHTVSNFQIPTGKGKAQLAHFERCAQRSRSCLDFPVQKEERSTRKINTWLKFRESFRTLKTCET